MDTLRESIRETLRQKQRRLVNVKIAGTSIGHPAPFPPGAHLAVAKGHGGSGYSTGEVVDWFPSRDYAREAVVVDSITRQGGVESLSRIFAHAFDSEVWLFDADFGHRTDFGAQLHSIQRQISKRYGGGAGDDGK